MQTWSNQKLIKKLCTAHEKLIMSSEFEPDYKRRSEKFGFIENELLRRLEITEHERFKIFKNGYDQGRFDEDFENTYKLGKYAEEGKDGLDNPNFEKVNLERDNQ